MNAFTTTTALSLETPNRKGGEGSTRRACVQNLARPKVRKGEGEMKGGSVTVALRLYVQTPPNLT